MPRKRSPARWPTSSPSRSPPANCSELLPADATLYLASSMPIRDAESFAPAHADAPRVLSNRGANGIDGTVSSAFGASAVSEGPVVLLAGDVAVAHDIGGLLAARRLDLRLTIVLLNNDGGGIFHFLPVADEGEAFVEHVATPHGLDFSRAAALYGCGYERPATIGELERHSSERSEQRPAQSSRSALTASAISPCTVGWRRQCGRRSASPRGRPTPQAPAEAPPT